MTESMVIAQFANALSHRVHKYTLHILECDQRIHDMHLTGQKNTKIRRSKNSSIICEKFLIFCVSTLLNLLLSLQ